MTRISKITRRQFTVAAGVIAVAAPLALAGCGGTSQDKADEADDATTDDPADAQDDASADYELLSDGVLLVATSPDYAPFENLEGDEYVGLDIDLIRAVGEKLGLEVEFKNLQFDAIIPAIAAGGQADCAISAFSIDPERAKEIDFTTPYYIDDLAIVVMNDAEIEDVDALDDAAITIAAQSGTTGEDYAKENFPAATVVGYGNATDCFAAMQAGQADAVCTNDAVAQRAVAGSYTDAVIIGQIATGEEYAAVVSQDNPGLTAAINAAIDELIADGTVEEIIQKHMG